VHCPLRQNTMLLLTKHMQLSTKCIRHLQRQACTHQYSFVMLGPLQAAAAQSLMPCLNALCTKLTMEHLTRCFYHHENRHHLHTFRHCSTNSRDLRNMQLMAACCCTAADLL
jgi:hypothetical protein